MAAIAQPAAAAAAATIDLSALGPALFVGRPYGRACRDKLGLDALDEAPGAVDVVLPASAYSISSSFALGFFGPSVVAAGGRAAFREKYKIAAPALFIDVIDNAARRAERGG